MSFDGNVNYVNDYLAETSAIAAQINPLAIEALVQLLAETLDAPVGMVYILGLGGSMANALHLAADLRRLNPNAVDTPENLAELTALINDHDWDNVFTRWLSARNLDDDDLVLVLSVGGGDYPSGVSVPLANALIYARSLGTPTAGIVGEPGGKCADIADVVVKIPTVNPDRKTEHVEGWEGILHHLIVSHPRLRRTG